MHYLEVLPIVTKNTDKNNNVNIEDLLDDLIDNAYPQINLRKVLSIEVVIGDAVEEEYARAFKEGYNYAKKKYEKTTHKKNLRNKENNEIK